MASAGWDAVSKEIAEDLDLHFELEEFDKEEDVDVEEEEFLDTVEDIHEKAGPKPIELEKEPEEEVIETAEKKHTFLTTRQTSTVARYRIPLSEEEAAEHDEEGGLIWQAKIFKDGYTNKRFNRPDGSLKPRRAIPQVYASDFFSSLNKTADGRYIFKGSLNGWPALDNLELLSLEFWYVKKVRGKSATYTKRYWKKVQGSKKEPRYPKAGTGFFINSPKSVRATLRAPAWSEIGFSKDSPGFSYYYAQYRKGGARIAHGENMVAAIKQDALSSGKPIAQAVRAHYFGHRYVKKKESLKDKITYHTGVLIEWDHGQFTTIIELAWLRGMGGFAGNSSWCEDSFTGKRTKMYEAMPDCLKAPWDIHRSEIRIIDHQSKNLKEFKEYMKKYEGVRYNHPEIKASGDIRLTYRSLADLAQYCNSYSLRDPSYAEAGRNCQTFAVDFFTFLTGKVKEAEPYYPVKVIYKERRHLFLYQPEMFEKRTKQTVRSRLKKIMD